MKPANILLGLIFLTGGLPRLRALDLQPATLKAWEDYLVSADSHMQARLTGQRPFLWVDEAPGQTNLLRKGKYVVAPAAGNGIVSVPGGLIHHWMGAVFIPGASLTSVRAVFSDYESYKDYYKPLVADSRRLPCNGDDARFSMIWQHRVLFISAAIEGEYQVHHVAVDSRRGYSIATTTRVREIESYGQTGERFLPPGQGSGFIWRMRSIATFEERDGGVYLELEAIALTRDIPGSLRWLVGPVVNHLSINSLTTTLKQTRDAVRSARAETVASRAAAGDRSTRPRLGEK
jgi:hypothetical protein